MSPAYRHCVGTLGVVLAGSALVAGCGGSYTKRDFVARADAICASALRQLRSIPPPSSSPSAAPPAGAPAGYLATVLAVEQSQYRQLRALRRPAQDNVGRAKLTRWLASLTRVVEDYRELATAAQRGNAEGVSSAEAALRASPVGSLAASYGLSSCASPGPTTT